ncbi:MAG: hypothetical protein ETSY2_13130 [Candidatus Entotheonella gemina]|uniref:Leucine-binding protein domain-containing protein n=1 Tax=Candidatus Entotheonella gemina TaxID=1429439 RepID=W4MA80_9BACT|nr:MAG: hypothetical protein ETSY2_13130 [Candidatus Entotheonella gemina]
MRRRFWAQLVVVLMILALIATPAMAQKKKSKTIKIGLLYALSGLAAVYTKGTIIGHEIAAEEINAKGGCIREKDYVCDPRQQTQAGHCRERVPPYGDPR